MRERRLRLQVREAGSGGTLVGINRPANPAKFYFPSVGVAGAVTAVLDFKPTVSGSKTPRKAVLSLHDPTLRETVRIAGTTRPLAAISPRHSLIIRTRPFLGLMEAIRVDRYYRTAGLTMLQPYDPERIPVVFVHGLISEPGMWRDTIDAVESDPVLRGRFQFWALVIRPAIPSRSPRSSFAKVLRVFIGSIPEPRIWCLSATASADCFPKCRRSARNAPLGTESSAAMLTGFTPKSRRTTQSSKRSSSTPTRESAGRFHLRAASRQPSGRQQHRRDRPQPDSSPGAAR